MTRRLNRVTHLEPVFVDHFPERLESGRLYISTSFNTTAHLCACGCGHEIIAPLSPAQWRLTWDGQHITLYPSIGNWNIPCQSHYWICNGRIRWAGPFTPDRIRAAQVRDLEGVRQQAEEQRRSRRPWWTWIRHR